MLRRRALIKTINNVNNVIHYTAMAKVEANSDYPWSFDTFGANILSHDFNEESGEGVITFDADVTTIGARAFYLCDNLTSITIPNSVTIIGGYSLSHCARLTSVNIPDSVTQIGRRAFYECNSLTSVYCEATTPPSLSGSDVFTSTQLFNIYVPSTSLDSYKNANNWSNYAEYITSL